MTRAWIKPPATFSRTVTALFSISPRVVVTAATISPSRFSLKYPIGTCFMCSPISSRFSEHMEKLPSVLLVQDKLLKKIRPVMLTAIMTRDTQTVETGMTPPSAAESSPDRIVRIAMIGIISKTESRRLKTKEAIKFFRCFPEKSNSRLIS